ncbi:MAG: TraR/DksA C4-type zinc finger protein [Herpetosiphon sp.]|nr:TraR/DksA C4-type zinc finger protein [Herpetosiphon sp.]
MKQDQLDYFRKRLLETKDRLMNEIAVLEEATDELNQDAEFGVSNHMADDATDIYEREKNFALIEDRKGLIDQVDAALERIEQGTYGICIKSGQQIPLERLEVLPYAATTVGVH